jgi:hypothetical protein
MQSMQKIMPIIFGYIYFIVPAAVVIYMIVSTTIRIATQDIMFRTGVVQPVNAERAISGAKGGASSSSSGVVDVVAKETKASPKPAPKANGATRPGATKPAIGAGAQSNGNGNGKAAPRTNGNARPARTTNGKAEAAADAEDDPTKPHPRSKNKRDRRAR